MKEIHNCENCIYFVEKKGEQCELEFQLTNKGDCEWYEPHMKPLENTVKEITYRGGIPFEIVATVYNCPICGAEIEDQQEMCGNCECWIDWDNDGGKH